MVGGRGLCDKDEEIDMDDIGRVRASTAWSDGIG